MKVMTVGNIKGGVGKTALSILLAHYFSLRNKRVLLVDADPQGTASEHIIDFLPLDEHGILLKGFHNLLKIYMSGKPLTAREVRNNLIPFAEIIDESFWVLPNCIESSEYDFSLREKGIQDGLFVRLLAAVEMDFDFVIIDCPPYISSFLQAGIAVSSTLLIPCEATLQSYPGVIKMLSIIDSYRNWGKCFVKNVFIVPTKVQRTKESFRVLKTLRSEFSEYVIDSYLPYSVLVNRVYSRELSVKEIISKGDGRSINQKIHAALREIYEVVTYSEEEAKVKETGGRP